MLQPPPNASREIDRAGAAALALALFGAAFVPALARSPQNPDGAELVRAALQGGVLHPPGYPLQAWLDRAVFAVSPTALALSVASAVFAALAAYVLARFLRELRLAWPAVVAGVAAYSLFPAVWSLSVQPERYALAGLLAACALRFWARIESRAEVTARDAAGLGVLTGLCLAQHPMLGIFSPFLFRALRKARASRVAICVASAVVVTAAAYLSLFLLTSPGAWPDWGKLRSLSDLLHFVTRSGFSVISAGPTGGAGGERAIQGYLSDLLGSLGALSLLGVIGAVALAKQRRWTLFYPLLGSFALALAFLWVTRFPFSGLPARTYLERFNLPAALLGSVWIAAGMEFIAPYLLRVSRFLPPAVAAVIIAVMVFAGWGRADMSHDRMLDLFSEALGIDLPSDGVFANGSDLDIMYGATLPDGGGVRFPVFGDFPWVLERVDPIFDPRLAPPPGSPPWKSLSEMLGAACARGLAVYSPQRPDVGNCPGAHWVHRGILWMASTRDLPELDAETLRDTLALCPLIERIDAPIPGEGHFYSRHLLGWFVWAFEGAAIVEERSGHREESRAAAMVALSLKQGAYPEDWIAACARLARPARSGNQTGVD